ncbi:MAG: hypothetical protein ABID54_09460 [Pseudomonadota bacterium]
MPKPSKKSSRKFLIKMLINSREWELWTDAKSDGAWFSHCDPGNDGKRVLTVGVRSDDPKYHAELLLHEILEIIFETDGHRYKNDDVLDDDHSRYLFVFNHDYLDGVCATVLTALLTSGFFELKEKK